MTESAPAPAPFVIRARGVRKSYGDVEAVAGVDVAVRRGEVFAMLGPTAPARRAIGAAVLTAWLVGTFIVALRRFRFVDDP